MSGVEIALSALLSVTNVPGYYACYTEAVTGTVEVQRRVLAMPSNECVRIGWSCGGQSMPRS